MNISIKRFDVVGLGVSTLDCLMVVDDFPADESVRPAHRSLLQGGGPVATALVALSRLGSRTAMVDRVGGDWRGRLIVEEFRREGVSTEGIVVDTGKGSSIALVLVREKDGARSIVYSPGDTEEVDPTSVPRDLIASSKILHLNGRHLAACLSYARVAKEEGVTVSFDGGAHRFRPELVPLIDLSDLCIVAREFAYAFSGESEVEPAASKLLQAGPATVVVTSGLEGSRIFAKDGDRFHQPAFHAGSPIDTTGAGDAYHGAFLHGLARELPLMECARLASAVAAMNTTALGGRTALPTFEQAREFLHRQGHRLG